jgi:hypothetical protein
MFATNTIFEYIHWIIFCTSGCFFGLTIFISQELARTQHHDAMLKLSLILSAVEFLGLSGLYADLIWRAGGGLRGLVRYYQLTLAFIVSLLACISAFIILFLLELGHRICWPLALWVSDSSNAVSCYLIGTDTLRHGCALAHPFYNYWST